MKCNQKILTATMVAIVVSPSILSAKELSDTISNGDQEKNAM